VSDLERDDFVSGGGAIAYLGVALALALLLFLFFVLGLTPAWAGCHEICRELGTPGEWSQPTDHCCCIDFDETFCELPDPTPTPRCFSRTNQSFDVCGSDGTCFVVQCELPDPTPTPTETECGEICGTPVDWPTPECAEPSPTPLPTPESNAKDICCDEAREIRNALVDRAWQLYVSVKKAANAKYKVDRAQCRQP
jgi:hypothetical protein